MVSKAGGYAWNSDDSCTSQQLNQHVAVCPNLPPIKRELLAIDSLQYPANGDDADPLRCFDKVQTHFHQDTGSEQSGTHSIKSVFKRDPDIETGTVVVSHKRTSVVDPSMEVADPGHLLLSCEIKQEEDHMPFMSFFVESQQRLNNDQDKEAEHKIDIEDNLLYKYDITTHSHQCEELDDYQVVNLAGITHDHLYAKPLTECTENDEPKLKDQLVQHIKVKPDLNPKVYKCANCGFTTSVKVNLVRHIKLIHDPNAEVYKCADCDYTSKWKGCLRRHASMKHNPNAKQHMCSDCDYTSKVKGNLRTHVLVKHDLNAKVYKCADCNYKTKIKRRLFVHVNTKHDPNAELYKCSECDYETKRITYLVTHFKMNHDPNAKVYKCVDCDYTTKWKNYLLTHALTHVKTKHDPYVKLYTCSDCDYTTKWKDYLLRHVKVTHDPNAKVYKCVKCDYTTKIKEFLTIHERVKHDPDAER